MCWHGGQPHFPAPAPLWQVVLIATPEKALYDKVSLTSGVLLRSVNQTQAFLIEAMRMDEDKLRGLNLDEMSDWLACAPKASSLEILIKAYDQIREWLQEYTPRNQENAAAALREIVQEVALAGLQRTGFFEKAAFYGGTALRIFAG